MLARSLNYLRASLIERATTSNTLLTMNKPTSVSNAVLAIWVTLGISLLSSVASRALGQSSSGEFFGTLLIYGIVAIFPYKIGLGRNWARYVYSVLMVLTVATMFAGETDNASKIEIAVSWILLPVEGWILFSLFKPESGAWFEQKK